MKKNLNKYKKIKIDLEDNERIPVEIIDISTVSSKGIADGKMMPVIFIDTLKRADIKETIENHKYVKFGDVTTSWFRDSKRDYSNLYLLVELSGGGSCNFIIHFIIDKHGPGVDLIIKNGGCYIQSAEEGTKIKQNITAPRLLMEVIGHGFEEEWKRIYQIGITKMFNKKYKVPSKKAAMMARDFIEKTQKINIRI